MKVILYVLGLVVFLAPSANAGELDETCKKLSAESEFEYEAVYAKRALFDYYPKHLCPRPEKCQKGQISVYSRMKAVQPFATNGDEWVSVYTKLVPEKEYWDLPIPRYFKGKYNKFCARKISEQEFIDSGFELEPNKYKIDHLETIQPYNPADNLKITPPHSTE